MNIRDLEIFTEIAQNKNMTRASERLGLTQPTLSAWLSKTEDLLKTKLFHRSKKGLELTDSGLRLLERSKDLTLHWSRLVSYVQDGDETQKIIYRFGAHESVAIYSLEKFLPKMQSAAPHIELSFKHDLSRRLTEDIISQRLDLGLIINPIPHPDLVIKKIGIDEVCFWQSKHCKNPTQLICDPELKQSQALLTQWNKKNPPFDRIMNSSSLELAAQLCAKGLGRAILPTRVAKQHSELTGVRATPIFEDQLCLVFRAGFQRSPHARVIIDIITQCGI